MVVLSQHVEEDYAFELLADGVAGLGYLLKERVSEVDDLVRALYDVARGGSALDPKVVEALMDRKTTESSSPLLGLTPRELEVLQELAAGRSNSATAKALFMSERAVEKHVGAVFQKLGLAPESEVNRRVSAVLAFLEVTGGRGALSGQPHPGRRAATSRRSNGQGRGAEVPDDDGGKEVSSGTGARAHRRRSGDVPAGDAGRGRSDRGLRRGR